MINKNIHLRNNNLGSTNNWIAFLLGALFCIMFAVVGGFFAIGSAKQNEIRLEDYKANGTATEGVIFDMYGSRHTTSSDVSYTKVMYYDMDNREHVIKFDMYSSSFRRGQIVEVYYLNDKPEDAMVPDIEISGTKSIGIFFIALGSVMGAVCLFVAFLERKKSIDDSGKYSTSFKVIDSNSNMQDITMNQGIDSELQGGSLYNDYQNTSENSYSGVNKDLL